MFTVQYTQAEVRRQDSNPQAWSIYNALTADELSALRAAGVRIASAHVMSRVCPQCGQPGEVGVCEDNLADGIAFIVRDNWTCRACRERETAHWVASPKPMPASRGGSTAGYGGSTTRRKTTQQANAARRQKAVNAAWKSYHDACDTLDAIDAGRIPASAWANANKQLTAAWHRLVRLGAVPREVQS